MDKPRPTDPVIDEIRETRRRISARFQHDPAKLVAYYIDLQERHKRLDSLDSDVAILIEGTGEKHSGMP